MINCIAAVIFFLLVAGCDPVTQKDGAGSDKKSSDLNNEIVFTGDDYNKEWEALSLREKRLFKTKKVFLEKRIDDATLSRLGQDKGYEADVHIAKKVALFKRKLVRELFVQKEIRDKITEKEINDYYNQNKHLFVEPERIRVRHILLNSEKEATAIQEELEKGKIQFQELARLYSIDTTASHGGDLGFFSRGRMLPEFEKEAFLLASPGDISNAVKTRFGYHIIQLVSKKEKRQLIMGAVKERIYDILTEQGKEAILNASKIK